MILSLLAAVAGVALTAVQTLLIYLQKSGLCLNEGCQVVDSMTMVEPLYFNIAGLTFFLIISFGLLRVRNGSTGWQQPISLLLLAGLAAEAVLLSFQIHVVGIYCSYCVIILGLVVAANVFLGLRQVFKGFLIFSAVMIAFTALDFNADTSANAPLTEGTMARFAPDGATRDYVLFFSSDCTHCETVLGTLGKTADCAISFNPVDTITRFSLAGATFTDSYRPQINRDFLKRLDIATVPVLLSREQDMITIVKGETAIRSYLAGQCVKPPSLPTNQALTGQSTDTTDWQRPIPDDGCSILEDCEQKSASPAGPAAPPPPSP